MNTATIAIGNKVRREGWAPGEYQLINRISWTAMRAYGPRYNGDGSIKYQEGTLDISGGDPNDTGPLVDFEPPQATTGDLFAVGNKLRRLLWPPTEYVVVTETS